MYKDFKHIKNVSENEKSATMLITKRIGNTYDDMGNITEYGIRGDEFANEMLYLKACMQVENVEVEINSAGGDVTEDGYNIVNAIIKHKANTKVVGLAASMAGICAMSGEKRSIVDYGTIMCHPVSGGDGDNKVLGIIQDSLKTILSTRTKLNGDTLDNMFKKETWISNSKKADYNLQDAVDMGMIDSIISSGRKVKMSNEKSIASAVKFYNSINENPNKMIELKKKLGFKAEISDEKTETAAIETIESLEEKNKTLTNELETAKKEAKEATDKLKLIEDKAEADKTAEATLAVENALKAGKFKAEEKADMLVMAKTNLKAFNALVGAASSNKEANKIPFGGGVENAAEDRTNWTAVDWSKKDPDGLRNKLKENPDFYNTLKK